VVVLCAARALWRGIVPATPGVTVASCPIDVNRASVGELQALPGVGPGRAEALVLERIRHGPFARLEQLARVHGFGPELLRRLAPHVRF
jgi:competence protein ComEA